MWRVLLAISLAPPPPAFLPANVSISFVTYNSTFLSTKWWASSFFPLETRMASTPGFSPDTTHRASLSISHGFVLFCAHTTTICSDMDSSTMNSSK